MFAVAMIAVLVTMSLALARALLGPTVYDRILAVNSFGTAAILFIAVLGYLTARPEFLDIALVYALINYIGTIAVLKFGIMDSLGMGCLFAGMALQTSSPLVLVKLFFIYAFVLLTGPAAIHALARAALHAGLKPQLGNRAGGDSSTR